jgi:hypothetical protein
MMYGFEIINLSAVLGIACLMLAILMVWRSPFFFGRWLPTSDMNERALFSSLMYLSATVLCMVIGLCIIAYTLTVAPKAGLQPIVAATGILGMVLSFLSIFTVVHKRTIRELLIDGLYCVLFIVGGSALLLFWPS